MSLNDQDQPSLDENDSTSPRNNEEITTNQERWSLSGPSNVTQELSNIDESNILATSSQMNESRSNTSISSPIRVPGTYPPEWLPDNETESCMACDLLFTIIKRRHHCRACGKIFCNDCCHQKAKLPYLDNKEARVCDNCSTLIKWTLSTVAVGDINESNSEVSYTDRPNLPREQSNTGPMYLVQGVLKTSTASRNSSRPDSSTASCSSSLEQQANKQVMFSDGIRPGTDLSEPFPYRVSSPSSLDQSSQYPILSRQSKSSKKNRGNKNTDDIHNTITVYDDLGYLPPIVLNKCIPSGVGCSIEQPSSSLNSFASLITSHLLGSVEPGKRATTNSIVRFEEIMNLINMDGLMTFLLLRDFYLKVKIVNGYDEMKTRENEHDDHSSSQKESNPQPSRQYWCFASDGLARFKQNELVLVLDKDEGDLCIPRDVFKIYLTLHELGLRRQSIENLGNLLFQDGLFDCPQTAGLLFVRHMEVHNLDNLIRPENPFLFALVLQRWEVPWSKVFPVRLLLRLGHKFGCYPYPLVSYRKREPVYYEVGHTIISILGDFRNFRYSITHVDGLKVMIVKSERKVLVQLSQASYQQFNKVLDRSSNEHVLAWSAHPFLEADGHLVSVQNEDGQYETVEFYKEAKEQLSALDTNVKDVLGASFVIFSGALKVNQSGQLAKISIVEDGLLIQLQSCTLSALKQAIHYMRHFDIDCGKFHSHLCYSTFQTETNSITISTTRIEPRYSQSGGDKLVTIGRTFEMFLIINSEYIMLDGANSVPKFIKFLYLLRLQSIFVLISRKIAAPCELLNSSMKFFPDSVHSQSLGSIGM